MPHDDKAITVWIGKLGEGDSQAAEVLWQQYFDKLVRYARKKLDGLPRRVADEEDVALSAMHSFCRGMRQGSFQLDSRDDLWKLLLTITARKAYAQRRRQRTAKRGEGQVRGESVFISRQDAERDVGIAEVLGSEPTPELAAMVAENCTRLLDTLQDETLRQVALYRLEGYSNEEIAAKLGCVTRSVERKLARIRAKWAGDEELS